MGMTVEQVVEATQLQKSIEIAKKMLKEKVPVEIIEKFTELSKEEIEKINK